MPTIQDMDPSGEGGHGAKARLCPPYRLLSELSGGVTGEIHYVDSGYNVISMPRPDELKADGQV